MLRKTSESGQTTTSEVVILLFIVVGAVVAMSSYFQRGLQARMRDANAYIINMASEAYGKKILDQYEPYYGLVQSNVERSETTTDRLIPAPGSGISRKTIGTSTAITTNSYQAPPREGH